MVCYLSHHRDSIFPTSSSHNFVFFYFLFFEPWVTAGTLIILLPLCQGDPDCAFGNTAKPRLCLIRITFNIMIWMMVLVLPRIRLFHRHHPHQHWCLPFAAVMHLNSISGLCMEHSTAQTLFPDHSRSSGDSSRCGLLHTHRPAA